MQKKNRYKLGSIGLAIGLALLCLSNPVKAGSTDTNRNIKLKMPTGAIRTRSKRQAPCAWRNNTLLVMPFSPTDDESRDSLKELQGTVTRTIGQGPLTVWEVTFEDTEHFAKAEKELTGDKKFRAVQRNYIMKANETTNDPYFSQLWHLQALNVPAAWDIHDGSPVASIAVIDTGVSTNITDLQGKCFSGYDAVNNTTTQYDVQGHGTLCSTTAAAIGNNSHATVGPARFSTIYPIRAGQPDGFFYTSDILDGFYYTIYNTPAKLINFSVNGTPPYTIANKSIHQTLHAYMKYYHDQRNGLIFNAAGNDGLFDGNPFLPYMIVVSALGESNLLTDFSNYGNCIWFTAPGDNIFCSDENGAVVSVAGTSFASPLACSVAALMWGAKPGLTNLQIETIMKNNSLNSSGSTWNIFYGYGLPDAAACVQAAVNTTVAPPASPTPPKTKKKNPNKLWKRN